MSRAAVFGEIYARGVWGDGPSRSGAGSDPDYAAPYVVFVEAVIRSHGVRSVVDVGHGDWVMWPERAFAGLSYVGVDVAPGLSESVRKRHAAPGRTFCFGDAVSDPLPPADLVLCKDVLQHLPNEDIDRVMARLARFPLIVISHDVHVEPVALRDRLTAARGRLALRGRAIDALAFRNPLGPRQWRAPKNVDIPVGDCRPLDLERGPLPLTARFGLRVVGTTEFRGHRARWTGVGKRIWLLRPG